MSETSTAEKAEAVDLASDKRRVIKVLVWDLDHTLWDGTLVEGDDVQLRPGVLDTLKTLDERGILHSISSKNDYDDAMQRLRSLGVEEYFLYPQIHWSAKSGSLEKIAETINVGLDALAFIDDQPFEREEVSDSLPQVMTLDATEVESLVNRVELQPRFVTDESSKRRKMYQADAARNQVEGDFVGPKEEFLAGLGMKFILSPAGEEDLKRAEELTVRTNQLNSTGVTYSHDQLDAFRHSDDHILLVASLDDKYGTYGKIGLALVEKGAEVWHLKLILMSCRVMARGVGSILMSHLLNLAKESGARFRADFRVTGRNRLMQVTYRFAGFKEVRREDDVIVFEHDYQNIQPFPDYVDLRIL